MKRVTRPDPSTRLLIAAILQVIAALVSYQNHYGWPW